MSAAGHIPHCVEIDSSILFSIFISLSVAFHFVLSGNVHFVISQTFFLLLPLHFTPYTSRFMTVQFTVFVLSVMFRLLFQFTMLSALFDCDNLIMMLA